MYVLHDVMTRGAWSTGDPGHQGVPDGNCTVILGLYYGRGGRGESEIHDKAEIHGEFI